jgi:predicted regulator of Ras-like GTPase activity (Roadblock/LC7/MglB family)
LALADTFEYTRREGAAFPPRSEGRGIHAADLMTPHNSAGLAWLLDNLVGQVEHIRQALVLSGDGLVVAASGSLSRDEAERLSAVAAGLQSLARGAGQQVDGGEIRQTIVEMDSMFLFITAAGEGTSIAVTATGDANVGLVAYETAMLVRRMSKYLAARPRSTASRTGADLASRYDFGN